MECFARKTIKDNSIIKVLLLISTFLNERPLRKEQKHIENQNTVFSLGVVGFEGLFFWMRAPAWTNYEELKIIIFEHLFRFKLNNTISAT